MAKILMTKLGLDGHDVGVKVLAVAARDAGHEVVLLGIRQTVETVTHVALQEDVDAVAVSILSGAHNVLLPSLVARLRAEGIEAPVIAGGLIPPEDIGLLEAAGVAHVVRAGTMATAAVAELSACIEP